MYVLDVLARGYEEKSDEFQRLDISTKMDYEICVVDVLWKLLTQGEFEGVKTTATEERRVDVAIEKRGCENS